MDDFVSHWGACLRQFPSLFILQTGGYARRKTWWMRQAFPTCNFSFVLSGRGQYLRAGRLWEVEAPAVICQWPGEYLEYGSTGDGEGWEELYLIYRPESLKEFGRCGLVEERRPCWKIRQEAGWRNRLARVMALVGNPSGPQADRLDRLCEQLILESLLGWAPEGELSGESLAVAEIQQELRGDLGRQPDFSQLARRHGMSDSTFRRRWRQSGEVPPAQFLARLRIQEACRQLVETRASVGEIAASLGFEDPLYFSRKFRAQTGLSATEYRRNYRV